MAMKIEVEKALLVPVLQRVHSITEKKSNMPILFNALIKATEEGKLEFSATDLELNLWIGTEARVIEPGSTTVPARKLLEVVRELPQETVSFEMLSSGKLLIRSGRARFELATIHAEDFPYIPQYETLNLSPFDPTVLRRSLQKTLYGVPSEDEAFAIAGVYWHPLESGEYRFVSMDGHRLYYSQLPANALPPLEDTSGVIIPRKGVQELLKTLEKETEGTLGFQENVLVVKTPSSLLGIRLLQSAFPEYETIIPPERPFIISLEWDNIYHAMKRVSVLTSPTWCHVRFLISNGVLELQAGNPELGEANETLDIDYTGEEFSIAFNARYVMDTLQAIESPYVQFEWVDEFHGGVFRGSEDVGYLGLIMPMVV
jgi:DNA polymerase III subunit beta